MKDSITLSDFEKIAIHSGTILSARINEKAKRPAYVIEVDFGERLGVKTSSAQLTDYYRAEDLLGKQVVAITNFPPLRVAGVKSEVLILGAVDEQGVTLLSLDKTVANGLCIA